MMNWLKLLKKIKAAQNSFVHDEMLCVLCVLTMHICFHLNTLFKHKGIELFVYVCFSLQILFVSCYMALVIFHPLLCFIIWLFVFFRKDSWPVIGSAVARQHNDGRIDAVMRAGAAGQSEGRSWVLRQLIGWLSVTVSPGSEWMWESMWLFLEGGVREREGWTANLCVLPNSWVSLYRGYRWRLPKRWIWNTVMENRRKCFNP